MIALARNRRLGIVGTGTDTTLLAAASSCGPRQPSAQRAAHTVADRFSTFAMLPALNNRGRRLGTINPAA
jgi:hypothetical protein